MATSVWRGYITFGLVSIPVRLFKAARAERVTLREVYTVSPEPAPAPPLKGAAPPEPSRPGPVLADRRNPVIEPLAPPPMVAPVRRVAADETGGEVRASDVGKGYEVEKGRFIALDREELRALAPKTSTAMELVEFVNLESVDPIYFETSYYIQPEEPGEKPYALLYKSLKETGLVGVAQIAMHRREHIVIVRSGKTGLIAHTMFFDSEVRADQEYRADEALVNPKELQLANTLVTALAGEFTPEKYRDNYREQLEAMIAKKVDEQPVSPTQPPPRKQTVDIMDALRKSLADIKKPAASAPAATREASPERHAPRRKTR